MKFIIICLFWQEDIIAIFERQSEIATAAKEVRQGKDVKYSTNLADQMTVEVTSPYKNINFRTWYSPSKDLRRPGWGIVLTLEEFEVIWEWADTWNNHLIGKDKTANIDVF